MVRFAATVFVCLPALALAQNMRLPAMPTTTPATRPAEKPKVLGKVAPDAAEPLAAISSAYADLKGLQLTAAVTFKTQQNGESRTHQAAFTSSFLAPNFFRHEGKDQPLLGCSGTSIYGYTDRGNIYLQIDASAGKIDFDKLPDDYVQALSLSDLSLLLAVVKDPAEALRLLSSEIDKLPDEQIDGQACSVLQANLNDPKAPAKLYFDAKTRLLRRVVVDLKPSMAAAGRPDMQSAIFAVDYTLVKPNANLKAEAFAWAPPIGARSMTSAAAAAEPDQPATALVGKPAPDFALEDMDGKTVKLGDLKGSVVVLDFWATWCGPCIAAMPHMEKIYTDLKPSGLKMYAVNQKEDKDKVQQFIERKTLLIPVILDADGKVGSAYSVTGIPTTVVIGKDGIVKHVQIGFNPDAADDTLKQKIDQELKAK